MPRQKLNLGGKIGGRNCKVRKRGCSSSSSSSLVQNYRLKRAILVGKRVGSSTPVPRWKMMSHSSKSPPPENDDVAAAEGGARGKELSVSARKLAATLWEIDGLPSPRVRRANLDDEMSELGLLVRKGSKAIVLSDLLHSPVFSERMDQSKVGSHRRRVSAGSQKLLQGDCNLGGDKSPHNCFVEVDEMKAHAQSPHRQINGSKTRLKDVYNGLVTSKEVLKIMSRICHFEQENSTALSLFSALKFELDRACVHVSKLIQENRTNRSETDTLLKKFEEEKLVWKLKEQDRIRNAITVISSEMENERKLRKQSERLNKKLGKELAETKASLLKANEDLEAEKRAREILEQVCDELARGVGEDRAEVAEMKRQSEREREEVEKEREMLRLADVIREERVQMKLSEAKYQFEEKNALVDDLRNELEAYLKSKRGGNNNQERVDDYCSPSYDKIKELEKYLRATLPGPFDYQVKNNDDNDDDDDSDDSDLHSIELNIDAMSKKFEWSDVIKKESKRNSVDKSKGRKPVLEKVKKPNVSSEIQLEDGIEWEFTNNNNNNKKESLDVFDRRGVFEFESKPWKKDADEDEIERYNMIKDLRDHIVSGSKMASSKESVSSKDHNEVVCGEG